MQIPEQVPNDVAGVDVAEARAHLAHGAVLLDVREPDEWELGHVEDATWIPLGELPQRFEELDRDQPVIVTCRSGGRSARAAKALNEAGYDAVNLVGGMAGWEKVGAPLVGGDGGPGRVA